MIFDGGSMGSQDLSHSFILFKSVILIATGHLASGQAEATEREEGQVIGSLSGPENSWAASQALLSSLPSQHSCDLAEFNT